MTGTTSSDVQRYQFTTEQAKIISSLAFHLRITGMIVSASGLFLCAAFRLLSLAGLGGIGAFLSGVLLITTSFSFQQISTAESTETRHLMDALGHLRNAHRLISGLMVVAIIVYLGTILFLH